MEGFVVIAAVAAAFAAALWYESARRRRQLAEATALAARYGFVVDGERKQPPQTPFDLFGRGHSKRVSLHMWRPGSGDSVFQYEFTTGSGKNRTVHRRTCALVEVPFEAPHTRISPEGMITRIASAVGFRDIEVESPDFNRLYRVRSDDERFAIALLDHEMIAWMLSPASGRGAVELELLAGYLLCVNERLTIAEMFGFHDWAQQFVTRMPTVLQSLYPPTPAVRRPTGPA